MNNNFYVYAWIRLDTNKIFYIGKGSGNRYKDLGMRNRHFLFIVRKLGVNNCKIIKLEENLEEQKAFEKERYYIKYYKDLGEPLTNISDGGDGSSGWFKNSPPEVQERHRQISKSFLGRKHSEKTKYKMSQSALAQHRTLSVHAKELIGIKNSKRISVLKDGVIIKEFSSLKECAAYYKISTDTIHRIIVKHNGFTPNTTKLLNIKNLEFKS